MGRVGRRFISSKPGLMKLCGMQGGSISCLDVPEYQPGQFYSLTPASNGSLYPFSQLEQLNGEFVSNGQGSPWLLDIGSDSYIDFTEYPDNRGGDPHDCINGECVRAAVFETIGLYPDLAACEAACGSGNICEGVCVPQAEIDALAAAINAAEGRLRC